MRPADPRACTHPKPSRKILRYETAPHTGTSHRRGCLADPKALPATLGTWQIEEVSTDDGMAHDDGGDDGVYTATQKLVASCS
jgi:hypothetical protein